jgi:hypothetical protein
MTAQVPALPALNLPSRVDFDCASDVDEDQLSALNASDRVQM